jgi:hypothetical protein
MEYEEYMNVTKRELALAQRLKGFLKRYDDVEDNYHIDNMLEDMEKLISSLEANSNSPKGESAELEGKQEGK